MVFAWEAEVQKGVKIFCGIPVTPSFQYLHLAVIESWDRAWKPPDTIRAFERSHGVGTAREKLVERFLATDCTHFLLLDGDIIIHGDTIQRMLQVNKPIVLGRYLETSNQRLPEIFRHSQVPFRRDPPIDFKLHEIFDFPKEDEDVILAGLGLMLVKREVFEQLDRPYFLYSSEYGHLDDYFSVSEDFWFLLRIQEKYRETLKDVRDHKSGDPMFRITYVPDIWVFHIGNAMVGDGGQVGFL